MLKIVLNTQFQFLFVANDRLMRSVGMKAFGKKKSPFQDYQVEKRVGYMISLIALALKKMNCDRTFTTDTITFLPASFIRKTYYQVKVIQLSHSH